MKEKFCEDFPGVFCKNNPRQFVLIARRAYTVTRHAAGSAVIDISLRSMRLSPRFCQNMGAGL